MPVKPKKSQPRGMPFGEVLSFLMGVQGVSVAELSARTGIPEVTLENLKKGWIGEPSKQVVTDITKALGVAPQMLLVALKDKGDDHRKG